MLYRLRALAALILVVSLVLQIYLRTFPHLKSGCQWSQNTKHRIVAFGDPQITGFLHLQKFRKKLDILGNDRFLARVAETVRRRTNPDYTVVLGDLLSSQWIPTNEFDLRADRYAKIFQQDQPGEIVNVTGNHDIGYHAELTEERVARFERRFGELNYIVHESPEWRFVVLNSLVLDGPPHNDTWHNDSIAFLDTLKGYSGTTVLATHIPLFKPYGICRDGPNYQYYPEDQGGGLKQQNHLSANATDLVLNTVFNENGGIVLAGHDHEGCLSSYKRTSTGWECLPGLSNGEVQEATVRSVMGEFGGNSGLVSGTIDPKTNKIHWEFTLCRFHIQHVWWITQVITIIGIATLPALFAL